MNIDVANRLYEYRRKNNLSQEELAEKIGVSRQAVSKWERAEASPDTDNLILLARLYNVSLDDLLATEGPLGDGGENAKNSEDAEQPKDKVHIGWDGIHVVDGETEVHIDKKGVFVRENGETVCDEKDPEAIKEKFKDEYHKKHRRDFWDIFPFYAIVTLVYIYLGAFENLWHPGWLVFFAVPIYYCMVDACRKFSWKRFFNRLPIPLLVTAAYLYIGFVCDIWSPTWAMFLIIPVYYPVVKAICDGAEYAREKKKAKAAGTGE